MHTYALFEDQSTSRLLCDFFTTAPGDDPVRLVFPDLEDTRVRNSASNGCLAAYQVLYQLGYLNPGEHFCLSFQFADHHRYFNSHGSSAGLAFCLKFAQEIYHLKTGRLLGYAIAATGSISDGTRGARIEAVQSLRNKLLAAFEVLSPGDAIFFPADNDADLDSELRDLAAAKEIQLSPVSTVDQALRTLLPTLTWSSRRWRHRVRPLVIGLVGLVGVLFLFNHFQTPAAGYKLSGLMRTLGSADSLKVEASFHYRSAISQGSQLIPASGQSMPELTLYSGDLYKFSFTANDSCFLYLYQMDSRGQVEQWPDPTPERGPLRLAPWEKVQIPQAIEDWLILDQQNGQDQFYVVAPREPDRELEELYRNFRRVSEVKKTTYHHQLLEKLRTYNQEEHSAAVFSATFTIQHDPLEPPPKKMLAPDLQISSPIVISADYLGNSEVLVMNADGSGLKNLTQHPSHDLMATWSPDGKRIAFISDRESRPDLFVMNADGSALKNLTPDTATEEYPAWSPDGEWIAFCSNRGNAEFDDADLYLIHPDGSGLIALDTTSTTREEQPAWSPTGERLAFVRSSTFDDHRLYTMRADGTDQRPLEPCISPINEVDPHWSPDGKQLLFIGTIPGLLSRIYLINTDGTGDLQVLIAGGFYAFDFSPEGARTAFSQGNIENLNSFETRDLYVMDRSGKEKTRLTSLNAANFFAGSWGEGFRRIGTTQVGKETARSIVITNKGNMQLGVEGMSFDDSQFSVSRQRFILNPGESREESLIFAPTRAGTSYATLTIASDDPDSPSIELIVNGTGLPGAASESPVKAF